MTDAWNAREQEALRALAADVPPPRGAEEALVAAVRGEGLLPRPVWRRPRLLAAAAGLAAFVAGAVVQQRVGPLPVPQDGRPRFLFLLYSTASTARLSEAQVGERVREYRAWAGRLAEAGHLVEAEKLGRAEYALGGSAGASPGGESVSGFFLVAASSLEEAMALARGSPHLRYGGRVVVRPVERTAGP